MRSEDMVFCFDVIKEFLVCYGKKVDSKIKDQSFTSYYYENESVMMYCVEYMNGLGFYINADSFFLVKYSKSNTVIKKAGKDSEIKSVAQYFEKIGQIKKLILCK